MEKGADPQLLDRLAFKQQSFLPGLCEPNDPAKVAYLVYNFQERLVAKAIAQIEALELEEAGPSPPADSNAWASDKLCK